MTPSKKRIIINIALILFFIISGSLYILLSENSNISLISGYISGGVGVALIQLYQNIKIHKNENYKNKVQAENDERNKFINAKSIEITTTILFIITAIFSLVCIFLGKEEYTFVAAGIILLYSIIWLITRTILNKKY